MKPKIFYIAGPYRSRWPIFKTIGIAINIWRARNVAKKIWAAGHYAICPHLNTAFFSGVAPEENFLKGDLEMLKFCNAIVLVRGWERSSGSISEKIMANKSNILVFYSAESAIKWMGK